MRKILLSSFVLILFSLALIVFQLSCQKESNAQTNNYTLPPATSSSLGGVIIGNGLSVSPTGVISVNRTSSQLGKIVYTKTIWNGGSSYTNEIWTVNYDGTQATRANIVLPSGLYIASSSGSSGNTRASLSPDGTLIFFNVSDASGLTQGIYACNVDGTSVRQVVTVTGSNNAINLSGSY